MKVKYDESISAVTSIAEDQMRGYPNSTAMNARRALDAYEEYKARQRDGLHGAMSIICGCGFEVNQ